MTFGKPGRIKTVFVEFGGDPSDDKECYKRYSSTEPFNHAGLNSEVIQFINKEDHDSALTAIQRLRTALKPFAVRGDYHAQDKTCKCKACAANQVLLETVGFE